MFLGRYSVAWMSKKLNVVVRSGAEAEKLELWLIGSVRCYG